MTATEEYVADSIAFLSRCAQHGDAVPLPFHVSNRLLWLVSDPASIQEILTKKASLFRKGHTYRAAKAIAGEGLFTADGELHRRHRRLITPSFQSKESQRYAELMIELVNDMTANWSNGQQLDICAEMSRLTLTVVARALFGVDLTEKATQLTETLVELLTFLHNRLRPIELERKNMSPEEGRRFAKLREAFDETVFSIIQSRRASGQRHDDLLDALLYANDAGEALDDNELRDEIVTLIISGHDTTGVTVSFALWLLAANPTIRAQAEQEVDQILGQRKMTFEDLPRLEFLKQIFEETLRLYPPVWFFGREALEDIQLPAVTIRKGDSAGISLFILHRDPRWWKDPLSFVPERFSRHAPLPMPGTYLPFGGGPRTCIGRSFAELEAILVLGTILQKVRLEMSTVTPPKLLTHL
jgi:cytochrome P450